MNKLLLEREVPSSRECVRDLAVKQKWTSCSVSLSLKTPQELHLDLLDGLQCGHIEQYTNPFILIGDPFWNIILPNSFLISSSQSIKKRFNAFRFSQKSIGQIRPTCRRASFCDVPLLERFRFPQPVLNLSISFISPTKCCSAKVRAHLQLHFSHVCFSSTPPMNSLLQLRSLH